MAHLCTPCDIISTKTTPPSGRAHPQLYCATIWSQSDWQFERYWQFCTPPIAVAVQIHTAIMSTSFNSSASPDMPPMAYQAPVPVPLPTYNWAASNEMCEFCLFKCQFETWTQICKIKAEEKLDYLLCILGKEGYATMDRWVPADEVQKNDPVKFVDNIESTLDDEISPQVHVYELEDITKRSDKSIDELVDWICQPAHRAEIGDGSDAAIEFKVQHRLIWAIPDANIEMHKQLLKFSHDKRVSCMLGICRTYFAVESGVAAMCAEHVVHAVCHAHQTHDTKLLTSYTLCPNCTHQHPPSRNNCPAHDSACKGCGKKGPWWAKCQSCYTTSLQASHHQPHFKHPWKGERTTSCQSQNREKTPTQNLFIAAMDCWMVGDMHPKEMIINNISSQQCNEAHTVIKLPASASSKGTTSVCVKIDTRSGGNILPLCLFQQLHPKQTSPDGLPIGLDPIQTKLPTYNGSLIPLYRILQGPSFGNQKLLEPNHAWSMHTGTLQTHLVLNLGLPACKKLAVLQVNCAVGTTQPNRNPTGTTPTQAARATKLPTARTSKSRCIKSTDDLMREFPDRFTGIGKFPGEYKIWLHPDAHPVIHAPRKCLITFCPKVKEHLAKMKALGVITHLDQATDWVSSITYIQKANSELCLCIDPCDLNRAIHHDHHKMPTVEEVAPKFANLHYFTKLDACHG